MACAARNSFCPSGLEAQIRDKQYICIPAGVVFKKVAAQLPPAPPPPQRTASATPHREPPSAAVPAAVRAPQPPAAQPSPATSRAAPRSVRAPASAPYPAAMTTLSQNNTVAGSLVLNDYINSSLQNTDVIGKETAVGRFEDPLPDPDGPLDHTLKPRSGNGGACSSLAMARTVETIPPPPKSGAFKKRYAMPAATQPPTPDLAPWFYSHSRTPHPP
eukprot:SAG31_NODE_8778_length_1389_cov_0.865891_2_plen_217_part_00